MFNKIYNFVYRVYRILGRTIIRYSSNPRPSSHPYFTGDGLRNFADFIYDNTVKNIIPENVREKAIIFVGDSNIKNFFKEIHPKIKNKYILISHNGDENIDEELVRFIDDKILKCYGINVFVRHQKIIPLPLGIENKHYYVNGIPWIFNRASKKNIYKKTKIFYAFTVGTNSAERRPALEAIKNNPYGETITKWLNFKQYMDLLKTYKFVVSPPGSCVEGHRTWDAMYIGVVPIVKRSITTDYFEKIGLPLWVVDDWSEISQISDKYLNNKYEEIMRNSNHSKLYIDYWTDKIKNLKD